MYIKVCMYVCMYIYIHTQTEQKRRELDEASRAQDEARNRDFLRRSRQILLDEAKNPQYARTETEQVKAAIRELSATLSGW